MRFLNELHMEAVHENRAASSTLNTKLRNILTIY